MAPSVLDALTIVKPETVIIWHRAGFRSYWHWKSRPHGGRPKASSEVRQLIREMSLENPLWGAPRIHGELLKLGIEVGQTTVAKYMAKGRRLPSQGWKTFLHNHADGVISIDLFVVPTISFRMLYGLLILQHSRRRILSLGVTAHPTAEWNSRQLTEACGWRLTPRYIVRDRDAIYGSVFLRRLRAMGIRSPSAAFLCGLLQPGPDAPIDRQGCSIAASRPCHRPDYTQAIPRRTSPSVHPGLIFDRHTGGALPEGRLKTMRRATDERYRNR